MDTQKRMRALSVRQPYAELILRGKKRIEYRSLRTNIRGRVYIYASLTPGDPQDFRAVRTQPGEFPTGVLVGTVEVVDCTGETGDFRWHLARPERLSQPLKPQNHPQPVWFYPFGA